MIAKPAQSAPQDRDTAAALKDWVMVALTLLFVALYGAALGGWLRPLADERMVMRLEPIIFVIIGYYFGMLPARQNERALKGEIIRQTLRADTAQHAKEQAQQTREALEEKVKNAKAALLAAGPGVSAKGLAEGLDNAGGGGRGEAFNPVAAAVNILNS